MKSMTVTVIGLFDLAEAEGRLLRQKTMQVMGIGVVLVFAALLMMTAVGLLLTALYYVLLPLLQPHWIFLMLGVLCLSLAGVVLWVTLRMSQKR